jgi:hypothetical protein
MKKLLFGLLLFVLFFCIIYGMTFIMAYGYYHWNHYISYFIDLVFIVVVIYVIEISVKKIDQYNKYDE